MRLITTTAIALLLATGMPRNALTQGHENRQQAAPASSSPLAHPAPYAGMQTRKVKALSDQQIADLRAGRGMGLALAAELNGYPGPLHAMELADVLGLSNLQRDQTKAMFNAMKAEVIPIGERIITEETALDRLFAEGRITPAKLAASTAQIAAAEGELRGAHLRYHLSMRQLLTSQQIARYGEHRGYARGQEDHSDP